MPTKTLVALYDHLSDARGAVDDLVSSGISRDSITLIANDATRAFEGELSRDRNSARNDTTADGAGTGATIGGVLGGLAGLLVGLGAFAIPGVGPIVAAGPVVAAITGAGAGAATGGILGGLTDLGVPESDAHTYAEGIRRGGTLVSVRLEEAQATRVSDILEEHNPVDIESRGASWRERGWNSRFESGSSPYDASEIAAEREMYGVGAGSTLSSDEDDEVSSMPSRRTL